jgi:hypothetical protein
MIVAGISIPVIMFDVKQSPFLASLIKLLGTLNRKFEMIMILFELITINNNSSTLQFFA